MTVDFARNRLGHPGRLVGFEVVVDSHSTEEEPQLVGLTFDRAVLM